MSKINDLIKQYCSDGVEHIALGSVAAYSDTRVDASTIDETTFVGVDNLLPNKAGRAVATHSPNTSRLTAYRSGDVLLGNIRPYLKKIWLATNSGGCSGDVLAIRIAPTYVKRLTPKFLYYVLSSDAFFGFNMQHAKGAKMPRGDKSAILKFRIPVPPLEVQQEIVNILDRFTQLEAELTAELTVREKQYDYYRNQLLTFDASGTEWKPLSEVGVLIRGNGLQKKDFTEEGVGAVHYGQIYTYYGTFADKTKSFVSPELAKKLKKAEKGDVLIAGVSENIEDVLKPLGWLGDEICISGDMFAFRHNQNTKYITYLLQTDDFQRYKERNAQGAKVIRVKADKILQYKIPVPTLEEQSRIASILDKFEGLVNSITEGLPAEIAARRQQYEHYRNKLLTFTELPA